MIAIADAFDAMTIDSVYRPAMSRERAIQELIDGSCTQFDPELAIDFNRMLEQRPEMLQGVIVDRWLQQLQTYPGDSLWTSAPEISRNPDLTVRRWGMRGITAVSSKRFMWEPDKSPEEQPERLAYIEERLRELKLLD